ncbi:MAG: alpha-amylase, partial [Flavobacterium sp.]|nr:alpha-amylase [Flavobacterium sp.]
MKKITTLILLTLFFITSNTKAQTKKKVVKKTEKIPFVWEGANLYFLMTDRFNKSEKSNEIYFDRNKPTGKLRGFEGGNMRGIIQKIDEGYFDKLGTNVIWLTPIVEQIHEGVDEGTGMSYGFHGYWTRDWTAIDPNFGTKKDLAELVTKAHSKGIRIMLDAVINHTGPVTNVDTVWPEDWVRTGPQCDYKTFNGTTACTLVSNLPDILTESEKEVELPAFLIEKWKKEGRYEKEMTSLNAFFKQTGYPRTPKFYIIKWLTDYISEFGIDGYRCDTVKHTDENVWADFKKECQIAFENWKKNNPAKVLDNNSFYTVAEVYNYGISGGQVFDFGDKKVNYYEHGFNNMINFEFKWDAQKDYETIFSKYSSKLNGDLKNFSVLNYLSSHDDGQPFDAKREKSIESGTKLLLTPGISQTYYGDETARSLVVEGTNGDAALRSFMNWNELKNKISTQNNLLHWQKLGQFRRKHPSIGAGVHHQIEAKYYTFSRSFSKGKFNDNVVVGLNYPKGYKEVAVGKIFKNGTKVKDAYSGNKSIVVDGKAIV